MFVVSRSKTSLKHVGGLLLGFALLAIARDGRGSGYDSPRGDAHTNVNVFPVVGGNSDVGVVGGGVLAVARMKPGGDAMHEGPDDSPCRWQLLASGMISFKSADTGLVSPVQDANLLLTPPDFARGMLRFQLGASYTGETTQKYYGLGNASQAPAGPNESLEYGRIHPTLSAKVRFRLGRGFYLSLGNSFTQNWVTVHPGTKLSQDMAHGSDEVRAFLAGPPVHAVDLFHYALLYDSRDNETSATRGQFHQALVRVSPGGTDALPYRYGQANLTARFFFSPVRNYLTFAARFVVDALAGDPPFYELARFSEDTYAVGGSRGVRGVPAQRYYGKIKAFSNLEARSVFLPFKALGKPFALGAAAFVDVGRVWTDLSPHSDLDGSGIGLKYGVGAGLRLHQGSCFVLRADLAYSPDARPVAAYFEVGEMF